MNTKIKLAISAVALTGAMMLGTAPASAYTVNEDAVGFVGKGEVQLALNLNNRALQADAATFTFTFEEVTVAETSWTCTNARNENTQERARTTTSTVAGLVSGVARDGKKQVTGFNLTGFTGTPTETSTSEGNQLNSCPTNWVLTVPAGDPEVVSTTGGLYVNGVLLPTS